VNRAGQLLKRQRDSAEQEHWQKLSGLISTINKMGPDKWLKQVWGLSGRAAESAWWGVLAWVNKLPKERR
jgi:hypothetical protein